MAESVKTEKLWKDIRKKIDSHVKKHLIDNYSEPILKKYMPKINSLVNKYLATLPRHVSESEGQDIANVARMQFFEAIKVWDPEVSEDVWPLAYSKLTGAMRDQIRFVTKASPTRLYEWITDAAYVYMAVEEEESFETKIDTGIVLEEAMKQLERRERFILINRFKHDRTFKEIGDMMNISESQITRVYKTAMKKLKKIVSAKGVGVSDT